MPKANLRKMLKSKEFTLVYLFLIFIILALFFSSFWGTLRYNEVSTTNVYFENFDRKVTEGSDFCFKFIVETENITKFTPLMTIYVNDNVMDQNNIYIEGKKDYLGRGYGYFEKDTCYNASNLNKGNNLVKVNFGGKDIFFNIEKVESYGPTEFALKDLNVGANGVVSFNTNLKNVHGFEPVEIYVNGVIDHRVYPVEGETTFVENVELTPGENRVVVKFMDAEAEASVEFVPQEKMNFFVGLLLFIFGFFVMVFFVYSKEEFVYKIALSIMSLLSIMIAIGFVLNLIGELSLVSFVGLFFIAIIILLGVHRKNFAFTKLKRKEITDFSHPFFILVFVGVVIVTLAFNIFTVTNYSYWNTYYERQADGLITNFAQQDFDELSYLGRDVGFIPGYFFLEAGIAWTFGLEGVGLFAVVFAIANLLFIFALFSLGKALGFSKNRIAILYFLLWAENFIRASLIVSPRHALSLSFFLIAMALLISNRRKVVSGVSLGFAAFIQTPVFAAFPILYIIISRRINLRELLKVLIVAAIIFVIFVLPIFLNLGLVSQAEKSNWGYLLSYTPVALFMDMGPLIIFFFLFTLFDIIKKEFEWDFYKLKLLVAAVLGTLFLMVVSARWNIFVTINLAIFMVLAIPEKTLKNKYFVRLFAVLILLFALFTASGIHMSQISNMQLTPINFVGEISSSQENVLADPMFGHDVAFFAERKVLADLAVEYAPEGKLVDSFNFLVDKNYSILTQYNIRWVLNQGHYIHREAAGGIYSQDPIEFDKLDKVYVNDLMYIHWVGDRNFN
jgi:hypothetical protein